MAAFFADLQTAKLADRVTLLAFSEFGRTIKENGSAGTDHGTATPMFVVGKPVKGGFYGKFPSLTDLEDGNLKKTTDFRSVYATMLNGWMGFGTRVQLPNGAWEKVIEPHQLAQLMAVFSGGFLAVACVFMVLFTHALRKRTELDLSALEVFDTKISIGAAGINAFTALVSLLIAFLAPVQWGGLSGMIYPVLLGPGFSIYYTIMGVKRRKLLTTAAQAA